MSAKLCIDCLHHAYEQSHHYCHHPDAKDVVTGGQNSQPCTVMRSGSGMCGPEGRWFVGRGVSMPGGPERRQPIHDSAPEAASLEDRQQIFTRD